MKEIEDKLKKITKIVCIDLCSNRENGNDYAICKECEFAMLINDIYKFVYNIKKN